MTKNAPDSDPLGDGDTAGTDVAQVVIDPAPTASASPLQVFDAQRTRELLRAYSLGDAAIVHLTIVDSPSTFSSLVRLTLRAPASSFALRLYYPLTVVNAKATARSPVTYDNLAVTVDGQDVSILIQEQDDATAFTLVHRDHGANGRLQLSMDLDSAFIQQAGRGIFDTWQLGIGIECDSASRCVVHLDHPDNFALRARLDNSEYHALAQGVAPGVVRKIGFFSTPTVFISYLYGLGDQREFSSLTRWPFATAFSLLAAGLMIAFDLSNLGDMAATALAFTLLPPLAQLASQSRPRYGSADIRGRNYSLGLIYIPAAIYVPAAAFAIASVTDIPEARHLAQAVCYILAGALFILGSFVFVGVRQQVIPEHYCDLCARRLWWSRMRRLHFPSRRTLCPTCFLENGPIS